MADPDVVINPEGNGTSFSPSRIFNRKAFQSGGAGMVGSPDDLFRFFETIRTGGGTILRPETVEMAATNQVGTCPAARRTPASASASSPPSSTTRSPPKAPVARGALRWGGVYGHEWTGRSQERHHHPLHDQHALRRLQRPVPLRYPRRRLRPEQRPLGSV